MPRRWIGFSLAYPLVALALIATLGGSRAQDVAIAWPADHWNPAPRDGDLVLPLPCGGAMVFRPVPVPGGGALGDRQVLLGNPGSDAGYADGPRYAPLAGSFTDADNPDQRLLWIGAYEVT